MFSRPTGGTGILDKAGRLLSSLLLTAVFATPSSAQVSVPAYQRTHFATIPVLAVNPFRDVKLSAVFVHVASGARLEMPVVAHEGAPNGALNTMAEWDFELFFTPHRHGAWEWWLAAPRTTNGAMVPADKMPSSGRRARFDCVPSSRAGWWRPDIAGSPRRPDRDPPGQHRHALIEPNGLGADDPEGWRYVRPAQTTFFNLPNAEWPRTEVAEALDWAESARMGRVRFALSFVTRRSRPNAPLPGAASRALNHTVFRKMQPGGNFTPRVSGSGNIDFESFDLDQWSLIDARIGDLARRGLHASVILCLNSFFLDYEEFFVHDLTGILPGSSGVPANRNTFTPIPVSAPSPFAHRAELYLWYVAGRLAAHPTVHYSVMHEWNVGWLGGTSGRYPFSIETLRAFGRLLTATDPYLNEDPNAKIVADVTGLGTFYITDRYPNWPACAYNSGGSNDQRLSQAVSPLLGNQDDDWRSCIGLQRGGELGLTSIVRPSGALPGLREPQLLAYPCNPNAPEYAHRPLMQGLNNERPILIEENWISRNDVPNPDFPTVQPGVSISFTTTDNPYAVYVGKDCDPAFPGSAVHTWRNENCFEFLSNNYEGLRKATRDTAWMAGVICQGHTPYWTRKYDDLAEDIATTSWAPYPVIDHFWNAAQEWWAFRFDPDLVVGQSPQIVPLRGLPPSPMPVPLLGDAPSPPTFGTAPGARDWTMTVNGSSGCLFSLPPALSGSTITNAPVGRVPFEQMVVGARKAGEDGAASYVFYCPVGSNAAPAIFEADLRDLKPGSSFRYFYVNPDRIAASREFVGRLPEKSSVFVFPPPPAVARGEFNEYVVMVNCVRP